MNKIKLLYDVVMAMREKEVFRGTLKGEGFRDQVSFFSFTNEFERDTSSGQTKAKITTELDCDGKKVKHQSETEFTARCCHGHGNMRHGFMGHMHHHHGFKEHFGQGDGMCGGIKGKLTRVGLLLSMLNNLKVEEQADKSQLLSLNMKEIPEELKKALREKSHKHVFQDEHRPHCFMKELHSMDNPNFEIKVLVNQDSEVARVELSATGQQRDQDKVCQVNLKAELNLNW